MRNVSHSFERGLYGIINRKVDITFIGIQWVVQQECQLLFKEKSLYSPTTNIFK